MTQQVYKTDEDYMRQALALGRFGLGNTAPNPAVGCVLVKDERIIGGGFTKNRVARMPRPWRSMKPVRTRKARRFM